MIDNNEFDAFKNDLLIVKDTIIAQIVEREEYPFACAFSAHLVERLLKPKYKTIESIEGYYDNGFHYWNTIVLDSQKVIIDFTRVQFDFSKVSDNPCWHLTDIDYLKNLKENHDLQYEYIIFPNHVDYSKYIKRKWNYGLKTE